MDSIPDANREWLQFGPASLLASSDGRAVREVAGTWIAVFRIDGELFAVEDRCTHADVPLGDGDLDGTTLRCPAHGAWFCLRTGRALTPPAYSPLTRYAVLKRDGQLLVRPAEG
jgi:3-phenylpropionate/trans-cinnamate dioxygenase ferredoxin component